MAFTVVTNHDGVIFDTQFDYYGKRFATCGSDGKIKLFFQSEDQATQISEISFHQSSILCIAWSHPQFGSLLASGGIDRKVIICKETQQNKWTLIYEYEDHTAPITCLQFSPSDHGLILLVGSADGSISLLTKVSEDRWDTQKVMAHQGGVNAVFWSPASAHSILDTSEIKKRFVSAGSDGLIRVWHWEDENLVSEELKSHTGWVRDVTWLPVRPFSWHKIVSVGDDGSIIMYSENDGSWNQKIIFQLKVQGLSVNWSDSGLISVTAADGITRVLREIEGEEWEVVAEANDNGDFQNGHIH